MRKLLLSLVVIAACDNLATTPSLELSFSVVSGDGQSGIVDQPLPSPVVIQATDSRGRPQKNLQVSFVITSGGGSANPASARTDQNGLAQTWWTLGTSVAQAQGLEARAGGTLLGAFTATPLPGPVSQLAIQAGDGQSAVHDAPVAVPPAVLVRDQYGNPTPGVAVSFTVTAGGGSVTGSPATTAANGSATAGVWTLGHALGANTLRASVSDVTPLDIGATAVAGSASRIVVQAGDAQSAQVNTRVAVAPAVRVTDDAGYPVGGTQVTFAVTGGGGQISPASAASGADGVVATVYWQLGTRSGANTLVAKGTAVADTLVFTATGIAGPATRMVVSAGDSQTTRRLTPVPIPPAVRLTDQFDNPVPGVSVTFWVPSYSTGSVTGSPVTSNAAGIATVGSWTPGSSVGYHWLNATAPGPLLVSFTATATLEDGARMALYAGDNQVVQVGTTLPIRLAVRITDATSAPIPGAQPQFSFVQGGGGIGASMPDADTTGVAAVNSVTLCCARGTYRLRATLAGSSDTVFFSETGTPARPVSIAVQVGNGQSASTNTAVPVAPAAVVRDTFGNPVPRITVDFAVTAGGGSVSGNPATTDTNGVAALAQWLLGPTPGTNTLTATASGVGSVTFTATGVAPVIAVTRSRVSVSPISIVASTGSITSTITVSARDTNDNPVVGASVTLTVAGTGNTITQPTTVTDANGVATGAVSSTVAEYKHVWATITGKTTFPATVEVTGGPPVTMVAYAGDNQVATVGTALALVPQVLLRDPFGNGSYGTVVTWEVTGGGGSMGSFNAGTTAGGVSTGGIWTLGTAPGLNMLQATVQGTPLAVTFSATGDPSFWTSHAALPTFRFVLGAAAVNGLVYAVGGMNFEDMATVEAYDPATNTWAARAPLPSPRSELAVAVVNNVPYAIGGVRNRSVVGTVEAYDPVTDSWTSRAPMPTPRADFGVAVVNGIIYTIGGASATSSSVGTVEAYDPATDTWTTKAAMPTPRLSLGAAEAGGIIYAVGGSSDATFWMSTVEAYDPASDTWTPKASLPTARFGLGVAAIDGRVYALGGYTPVDNYANLTPILEAYDPATNSWTAKPAMLEPRVYMGTAVLQGLLYVVGGMGGNSESLEVYHP